MDIRSLLFGSATTNSTAADFGLMFLRVCTGLALIYSHGYSKLADPNKFINGAVAALGFPAPTFFGWAAILTEFVGGILLAIGLMTRPAAFMILCVMLTAFFGIHANDPFKVKELAAMYAIIAVAFMFFGSGRFGFDWLIKGGGRRRR